MSVRQYTAGAGKVSCVVDARHDIMSLYLLDSEGDPDATGWLEGAYVDLEAHR